MPGYEKENIKVTVDKTVLTIVAKKVEIPDEKSGVYYRKERTWGQVTRSMFLPTDCAHMNIETHYTDGILSITFQRKHQDKAKVLSIK